MINQPSPSRPITASDLWSAARGLGMYRLPEPELLSLIRQHENSKDFAGQVIAEAARQIRAVRRELRA